MNSARKTPVQYRFQSNPYLEVQADIIEHDDLSCKKDIDVELLKSSKILYQHAFQKIMEITGALVEEAEQNEVSIVEIHLKLENFDRADLLIFISLEDYLNEKIDLLYNKAHAIARELENQNFHWGYSITYYSEFINKEKLISDGYQYVYEHISSTRTAQPAGL